MVKLFLKNSNLCDHNSPTSQTDGRTDGQTDRQTTCDRNTTLCTKVHRAVKTQALRGLSADFFADVYFLADRTNGRGIGTVLRPFVVVCTEYIAAKRCVLEQKLLLTAYRKSYVRNRLVQK